MIETGNQIFGQRLGDNPIKLEKKNSIESAEQKREQLRKIREIQDEKYRKYYDRFEERFQELLKMIVVNEEGQEVVIPNFIDMQQIYPLVPTRLIKDPPQQYEQNRQEFESKIMQMENDYHELKEKYEDNLIYHHQQFEYIGEHQLPNFRNTQFQNTEEIPELVSGKPWNEMLKIDLPDKSIPTDIKAVYPNLNDLLGKINDDYKDTRWPFVIGLNTQESAFMHYLLSKEKIRPLTAYFKNDFFQEFKQSPSRTELTKRARILAKLYCKNTLSKEQDTVINELEELRRIQREKEEHELEILRKMKEDQRKKEEILPPPPQLPINPDNSVQITVYNPELILRIQALYKQIYDWLEDRTFECYQKGKFKEALDYKKKREEVEQDMVVITNPEQLLRVLLLFKMSYKI